MAKQKGKKKVFLLVLILVIIAAIVAGVVILSIPKPLDLYEAARNTLFESSKISVTMTVDGEKGAFKADAVFGESVNDTTVDARYEGTDADTQVLLIKDGVISGSAIGPKMQIETLIDTASMGLPVEIDFMEYLQNILNGKIDEDELGNFYDKEMIPVLEEMYSEELDAEVELPTYYETTKIIERFLKKGVSDESIVMEKIDSERKGKTYEVTVDSEKLAEDFAAFAKEDADVKPLLESLVEASPDFDSVDDLAKYMIEEVSGEEKFTFEVTIKSDKITYIGFDDVSITVESEK